MSSIEHLETETAAIHYGPNGSVKPLATTICTSEVLSQQSEDRGGITTRILC